MRYRNRILNDDLDRAHRDFCGVGLKQVRDYLEAAATPCATAYRLALEIECANRRAKRKMGQDSSRRLYRKKRELIGAFIDHCQAHQFPVFRDEAHDRGQPDVLYAYLPGCDQISWHGKLENHVSIPRHERDWDGRKYSTLRKLENAIRLGFPESPWFDRS